MTSLHRQSSPTAGGRILRNVIPSLPSAALKKTKIQGTVSKALRGEGSIPVPRSDAGSRGSPVSVPPRRSRPLPRGSPRSGSGRSAASGSSACPGSPSRAGAGRRSGSQINTDKSKRQPSAEEGCPPAYLAPRAPGAPPGAAGGIPQRWQGLLGLPRAPRGRQSHGEGFVLVAPCRGGFSSTFPAPHHRPPRHGEGWGWKNHGKGISLLPPETKSRRSSRAASGRGVGRSGGGEGG